MFVCILGLCMVCCTCFFFFQAEDGIRDLVRSRGLGDVYKRQLEQAQTQVDGAGVQRIHRVVQVDTKRVARVELALSLIHI